MTAGEVHDAKQVVQAWKRAIGQKKTTAAQAVARAQTDKRLYDALMEIGEVNGKLSNVRTGRYLSKICGKSFGGAQFENHGRGRPQGVISWRLHYGKK
jgi:hypothetical protein